MNDRQKLLILGNSHTEMLRAAMVGDHATEVVWLKAKDDARFGDVGMAEAVEKVRALQETDCLAILHLGTLHNIIGLLNHDVPFTLVTAGDGAAADRGEAEMIPLAVMRAYFDQAFSGDRVVPALVRAARCRIVHPMTPPPKEAPTAPRSATKAYRGRSIAEVGFSPPARRLALWRVEREAMTAHLAALGVAFLDPPAEAVTAEGFLKPECCAEDVTHANRVYGRMLLDQLRAFAEGAPTERRVDG